MNRSLETTPPPPCKRYSKQHVPQYLQVAVNVPLRKSFDYLLPPELLANDLKPGTRVAVPFGAKELVGMVLSRKTHSDVDPDKIKPISAALDECPLFNARHLALLQWGSDYYHHPLGETIFQTLPSPLKKCTQLPNLAQTHTKTEYHDDGICLNARQQSALEEILASLDQWQPFLLHGVTGSGKTEVYLRAMEATLRRQRQVLVLLPEIALTPQTLARFEKCFTTHVAVIHSGLSPKQRLSSWLKAAHGEAAIVLGTRSAVWTPLLRPGLFIVDEEHDSSFKQSNNFCRASRFCYSARDVALLRAKRDNCPIILGSATPSLESLHNVRRRHFRKLNLPERSGTAKPAHCIIVDLRNQAMQGALSTTLLAAIRQELAKGNQVLLFRNRRGYSVKRLCHACGTSLQCAACNHPYTWHKRKSKLICHRCSAQIDSPETCTACGSDALIDIGHGTERIEESLWKEFPEHQVLRIDLDTAKDEREIRQRLQQIMDGKADIIVGTQMLAKGHHFPYITLTGILDADQGLYSDDYRSAERMLQLLVQVAGRSGRGTREGKVIVQTHCPEHPLLRGLIDADYALLAKDLLRERESACLPPYSFHALLHASSTNAQNAHGFLERACQSIPAAARRDTLLLGPVNAPVEKHDGRYRMQLLMQSSLRKHLHKCIAALIEALETSSKVRDIRWCIDVDPQDML
ncbi:MAG: replication restart helicase PriA [Candidatus Eutrophobiaceae bacterium]